MIPRIETERLILRGQTVDDFDAYAAFFASESSGPLGGPGNRVYAWDCFVEDAGQWVVRGYGQWLVEDRASGKAAGVIGFFYPDRYEEIELGWTVFTEFEGKSVAYEAALAARAYGAKHFGITRPVSYIDTDNARSIRLAERLGATLEETRDRGKGPFHIYRHPEPEGA